MRFIRGLDESWGPRWLVTLAALVAATMTACSLNDLPLPAHQYTPVSNGVLFSRIGQLPGVERVDHLVWRNGFDNPNNFGGEVYARGGVNAVAILDQVIAILWQGKPGADYGALEVVSPGGGVAIRAWDVTGLSCPTDLLARYGPQPGTGKVPPNAPKLRLRKPGDPIGCPPESTLPTPR